ncbi:methyl-accepting chemotaxis protein [Clostridium sp. ZS2-4]|uniref:methyl-accepting chemotaxis protein n=1 Tax=Clostridium sp. ZS2-4 TaxID=2987703 RepID=UPI00227B0D89|nr:methyl-accepting chemotaxis protein [Clostridium sp. ZS2-4]MCY6354171.1 methyl-accepting chemotaxis protein [Clostridium sp. ZS2-4]
MKFRLKLKRGDIFNSVGSKILIQILVLIIVSCSIIGIISYKSASSALTESIKKQLESRTKYAAKNLSKEVQDKLDRMDIIVNWEEIKSMNLNEQKYQLGEEAEKWGFKRFQIADLNGNVYNMDDDSVVNISDTAYYHKIIEGNRFITDVVSSKFDNSPVINLCVPIKDEGGKLKGALMGSIDIKYINDMVMDMKSGEGELIFILDKNGNYIANNDINLVLNKTNDIKDSENNTELKPFVELEKKMIAGESGFGTYSYKGIEKFMAYTPIPNTEWFIGLASDKTRLFSKVYMLEKVQILVTVIFIILGMIVGKFISKNIKDPLIKMKEHAEQIAGGNLSYKNSIKRKDEFGQTAEALNNACIVLNETISSVKDESYTILESSDEIKQMFEKVNQQVQQVTAFTEEISESMQQSSAGVEEAASMTVAIKEDVSSTAEKAKEGLDLALNIQKKAENINEDASRAMEHVEGIYEDSKEKLEKAIQDAKVVENISEMADSILEISQKTNLLALNAAIEAARAGEQGRGFAVVAEEVRKLAEQSSQAVEGIQVNVKKVLNAVNELSNSSEFVLKLLEKDVLKDYEKLIDVSVQYKQDGTIVKNIIENFAQISENIAISMDQMAKGMEDIASSVTEVANASEEIAENVSEVNENHSLILDDARKNVTSAEQLSEVIKKFNIE